MTDQVLTEDEKDALLEGVASGEVEVQSSDGPLYAGVTDFEISPRSRIVTNSFPRLQQMNRKLAGTIGKTASKLLNAKIEVASGPLATSTYGEFCEQAVEPAIVFEYSASPLEGSAVVFVQAGVVSHIVETFFGGSKENPPRHEAEGFTPGEMSVTSLFCGEVINSVVDTWQSLMPLDAGKVAVHQSTDIAEVIENSATVIYNEFDIHFDDDQLYFHVVWPTSMLAPLLPVLEGQKRDRDPVEDARWEQVLRARLPDASTDIHSCVGHARLNLRDVAELKPGDIIDFESPRDGTVFARHVAVLEGRFGVHDGHYAIETTRWLSAGPGPETAAA